VETARKVIESAFRKILAENSDSPLEADEYSDGLEILNDWMASQEALGIRLGYTPLVNVTDYVTVPNGALAGIKANLAILLAPEFSMPVPPDLIAAASSGAEAMLRLGCAQISTSFPGSLPVGSGNSRPSWRVSEFYQTRIEGSLALTANKIPTVFAGLGIPTPVEGDWHPIIGFNMQPQVDGKLRYTETRATRAQYLVEATLNSAPGQYEIALVRSDGSVIEQIPVTSPGVASLRGVVMLAPNDFLQLTLEAPTSTAPVTVTHCSLRVF
jgi:hypothetical protein